MAATIISGCGGSDNKTTQITAEKIENYTLFTPLHTKDIYLVNENQDTVHTWSSNFSSNHSTYLLESGELLHPGDGGVIEFLNWDSSVAWTTTVENSHHDVEILPNGNILAIVTEKISDNEAFALGRETLRGQTLTADAIYEICRTSEENPCEDGSIVWSWKTFDHIVQDTNPSISETYVSNVFDHQNKININYFEGAGSSNWTHVNSVNYNEKLDQIIISVRNLSEFWIIDHSNSSAGIIYRGGNPEAYNGEENRTLYYQHDAQWIDEGLKGAGNILVFNNGKDRPEGEFSSVEEYCYTDSCAKGELLLSYNEGFDGNFYSQFVSGAQRLSNGNTLVCEGMEGRIFEYDEQDNIVWELEYGESIFRAYRYLSNYPGLQQL